MKKIGTILLIIPLILTMFYLPVNAKAETLRDYQNKLQAAKDDYNKNQAEINQTQQQINQNKNEIAAIQQEFKDMANEIEQMHQEIAEANQEIKDKSLETKELFQYLQMANGENMYLEYAFGADNMTDFIYRLSIVEQLTEYNNKTIADLEKLIEENNQREKDLNAKEKEMEARQVELNKKVEELTGKKASLGDISVSKADEVKIQQEYVDYLISQGCQADDVIGVDCAVTNTAGVFKRPTTSGYVTSEFGYRWGSFHRAIDISNKNPYQTKIYPVANGVVTSKYTDTAGALVLVITHRMANGQYYSSLYAHMSSYAPGIKVGTEVTVNDYIGYMGMTGNATGPHLHLEIAPCRLYNSADKNCYRWDDYVAYMKRIYDNGSFGGPRDLINFPKAWVTYTTR